MTEKIQGGSPDSGRKHTGRQTPGFVNLGFSLLLVIFLVLTLALLALLALSEAENDLQFSRRMAAQRKSYYEACSQSEWLRSQISERLENAEEKGRKPDYSGLPVHMEKGKICWEIPMENGRILSVVYAPETEEILAFSVDSSEKWENDQGLSLWMP